MRTRPLPAMSLPVLERASVTGQLFLMYQPKLDLKTGAVASVEALARWHDPSRGEIQPSSFIPAVEGNGLIDWFTDWALASAVDQWSCWRRDGLDLEISVNISALNLRHVDFPDRVSRLCAAHAMPPERLTLELTESATQDAVRLMDTISRLRLKGIGISLDDFGTGYGSLIHLRSLPFTELKIDRNFVLDLQVSNDSRAITRALIGLAHELGLTVTAEGVEEFETLQTLAAFGCDHAQGFFIARPLAADAVPAWIRARGASRSSDMPGKKVFG